MFNTLLFVHLVVAVLLVVVILLQKTSSDGLSGIGSGSGNNMGIMSGRSAANFLTKTTIVLAVIFFANALILGNLSNKKNIDITKKIETLKEDSSQEDKSDTSLPIAK